MKFKILILVISLSLVTLTGCSGDKPAQSQNSNGSTVQESTQPQAGNGGQDSAQQQTSNSGQDQEPAQTQADNDGAQQAPVTTPEEGVAYEDEATYTESKNMLKSTDTATVNGISYSVSNIEHTQKFGSRKPENLADWLNVDGEGNLSGNDSYIFLTIHFTNTTDKEVEIYRNDGRICFISSDKEVKSASEAVYCDEYWKDGRESEVFHWILGPGESVTSEIGMLIHGREEILGVAGLDETWSMYYGVLAFDNLDHPDNLFIDLGLKFE